VAGKRLIGDDNSINSFDGKTNQIHGQFDDDAPDPVYSAQEIAPQIPFSRCVPGPLSLRQRVNSRNPIYSGTGYYATGGGDDDTQIGTSPAYSVTKDNTGN
jgi:hypothetical protein